MSSPQPHWYASRWAVCAGVLVLVLLAFGLGRWSVRPATDTRYVETPGSVAADTAADGVSRLWAHNLLLRKGSYFRVYVHWLRGKMVRVNKDRVPSLDAPESFLLGIEKGVIDVKLEDLSASLNGDAPKDGAIKDLKVENHDGQMEITGKAHKGVWLPVKLQGDLSPMSDGRIKFHLRKLSVLKLPLKGLFGLFHVELDDLVPKTQIVGVQVADNDVYFDTLKLLPPPHIHGQITSVKLMGDQVRVIYGGARDDEERMAQWHNFLRISGGSLRFGKLTMDDADLTLIDASDDKWFDLDLANYQAQLVYGTTRLTEKAGLEVYMPDLDSLPPSKKKSAKAVTLEWLKNRNTAPPLDVLPEKK